MLFCKINTFCLNKVIIKCIGLVVPEISVEHFGIQISRFGILAVIPYKYTNSNNGYNRPYDPPLVVIPDVFGLLRAGKLRKLLILLFGLIPDKLCQSI